MFAKATKTTTTTAQETTTTTITKTVVIIHRKRLYQSLSVVWATIKKGNGVANSHQRLNKWKWGCKLPSLRYTRATFAVHAPPMKNADCSLFGPTDLTTLVFFYSSVFLPVRASPPSLVCSHCPLILCLFPTPSKGVQTATPVLSAVHICSPILGQACQLPTSSPNKCRPFHNAKAWRDSMRCLGRARCGQDSFREQ